MAAEPRKTRPIKPVTRFCQERQHDTGDDEQRDCIEAALPGETNDAPQNRRDRSGKQRVHLADFCLGQPVDKIRQHKVGGGFRQQVEWLSAAAGPVLGRVLHRRIFATSMNCARWRSQGFE
jgi:hypothetical protein